jgi:cell division protein FtsA
MEYIAVLDLGSSKMLAMVASKDNPKRILATEQIDSGDSIRRGLIYKTTEAASKIAELVRGLNRKLKQEKLPPLEWIYAGVGGQGLHTKKHLEEKEMDVESVVDDDLLDSIRDKCQSEENGTFELIETTSPEYYVDGLRELHPQGVQCNKLEARFQLILGHSSTFKTEVEKALKKENVKLIDTFVSPIATAEQVLTPREKERGCALVELGAGITYLSIYTDSLLRYLVTIPLGGQIITNDISSLDKTGDEAESLKINEGNAWVDDEVDEFNTAIEARVNEIVANIHRQIEISGYKPVLKAGFILTGGASRLRGLEKLLEQQVGSPVRRIEENPEQSCARGLLLLGKENCAGKMSLIEQPSTTIFDPLDFPEPVKGTKKGKGDGNEKKPTPANGISGFGKKIIGMAEGAMKNLFEVE